jgi:hypothetical protein
MTPGGVPGGKQSSCGGILLRIGSGRRGKGSANSLSPGRRDKPQPGVCPAVSYCHATVRAT